MESRKIVPMKLFAGKEWRHAHGEWTCGHSGEGEGRTNRESSVGIYTLSCVKRRASEKLRYNREPGPALCDDLEYSAMT